MIKLSVVIITYNEERNISRCLESARSVADEIIVVDSFSTDKTETLCREAGARFFQRSFDDYSGQKNYAIDQASYDYILSLDADEALSEELSGKIREIKSSWTRDGYYVNRLTNYCGAWIRHCGWYPDSKLRLWDRRKGRWGGPNPHEKLIMAPEADIGSIKADILHYSFYSVEQHIRKINYYSSLGAEDLFQKNKKVSSAYVLFSPMIRFTRDYIIKRGFLDGYYGIVVSMINSYASFLKYAKLRDLYIQKEREKGS